MTTWRPKPTPSRFALLLLPVVFALFALWLWGALRDRAASVEYDPAVYLLALGLALSLVGSGMSIYLAWCAFTIRYVLDQSHLSLIYGGVAQFIPLGAITAVYAPGERVDGRTISVRWQSTASITPGYFVGEGRSPQLAQVLSVSTALGPWQLFVRTGNLSYALSPRDPVEFMAALRQREREVAGLLDEHAPSTVLLGPSGWAAPFWSDRFVRWLFLAGLVLNALLFGYLSLVYPGLPTSLPLHWNSQAQIDFIDAKQKLLQLPIYALVIWLANSIAAWWALPRERAVTLLLLAGALAAQVVFWAGVASIVLRNV
ncbi:MAG: PH domain-containing protein [Chloroflexia bacterium]